MIGLVTIWVVVFLGFAIIYQANRIDSLEKRVKYLEENKEV